MSRLAIFEERASRFLPLTWTRPLFELRCGVWTLREAVERTYNQRACALFVRDYLAAVVRERSGDLPVNEVPGDGTVLLLNGRLLAGPELPLRLPLEGEPRRYVTAEGTLVGARVTADHLLDGWQQLDTLPEEVVDLPLLEWPWELVQDSSNSCRLAQQTQAWPLGQSQTYPGVHLINPDSIFIHPSACLQPGVVLDASEGPLVVEENARIMANSVIQGPGYIGPNVVIKIGTKIYHGTTIGPVCKVGGEVEETIFQGYANKQHDGFLGHAYVGEWCNFGANTNNSDLKNNYNTVSVWCEGIYYDTGARNVGLLMADHAKTGIGSMFNTGTVVGVSSNLFGGELPPKFVPPFAWGGTGEWSEYRLEEALKTAERVMARREVTLTEAEREMLTYIFTATAEERRQLLRSEG